MVLKLQFNKIFSFVKDNLNGLTEYEVKPLWLLVFYGVNPLRLSGFNMKLKIKYKGLSIFQTLVLAKKLKQVSY